MATTIVPELKYIGVGDYDLGLFESQYPAPKGITYNSYLILDEKVALMDTVDARMTEQWRQNLIDGLGCRNVDYLVVHHLEPDHSANIRLVMEMFHNQADICGMVRQISAWLWKCSRMPKS